MFRLFALFRKTSWKIEKKSFDLFQNVFTALPDDYRFLLEHLNKGLYRRYAESSLNGKKLYSISFDPSQSDGSMTKGKKFRLENIRIVMGSDTYEMSLSIFDGVWIAFEFDPNINDLHHYRIEVTALRYIVDTRLANSAIHKLVKNLRSEHLDFTNLAQIEHEGAIYYQIKDLEDGNYLAINDQGQVFGLIHDPFKVDMLSGSIRQFVKEINSGVFNLELYLETGKKAAG